MLAFNCTNLARGRFQPNECGGDQELSWTPRCYERVGKLLDGKTGDESKQAGSVIVLHSVRHGPCTKITSSIYLVWHRWPWARPHYLPRFYGSINTMSTYSADSDLYLGVGLTVCLGRGFKVQTDAPMWQVGSLYGSCGLEDWAHVCCKLWHDGSGSWRKSEAVVVTWHDGCNQNQWWAQNNLWSTANPHSVFKYSLVRPIRYSWKSKKGCDKAWGLEVFVFVCGVH